MAKPKIQWCEWEGADGTRRIGCLIGPCSGDPYSPEGAWGTFLDEDGGLYFVHQRRVRRLLPRRPTRKAKAPEESEHGR